MLLLRSGTQRSHLLLAALLPSRVSGCGQEEGKEGLRRMFVCTVARRTRTQFD